MAAAPQPTAPVIVAANASKLFLDGAVTAFRQLDLEVRDRETLCIVGPSGCGKTTLLRCIAGLTDLSGGKLVLGGARDGARRGEQRGIDLGAKNLPQPEHDDERSQADGDGEDLPLPAAPDGGLARLCRFGGDGRVCLNRDAHAAVLAGLAALSSCQIWARNCM